MNEGDIGWQDLRYNEESSSPHSANEGDVLPVATSGFLSSPPVPLLPASPPPTPLWHRLSYSSCPVPLLLEPVHPMSSDQGHLVGGAGAEQDPRQVILPSAKEDTPLPVCELDETVPTTAEYDSLRPLCDDVSPSALAFLWAAAASFVEHAKDENYNVRGLIQALCQSWVEKTVEASHPTAEATSVQEQPVAATIVSRPRIVRLVLLRCCITTLLLPYSPSDVVHTAVQILSVLLPPIGTAALALSDQDLDTEDFLAALASSYSSVKSRAEVDQLTYSSQDITKAIREITKVCSARTESIQATLNAWTFTKRGLGKGRKLFRLLQQPSVAASTGESLLASPSLIPTLLTLCEDWQGALNSSAADESRQVLQLMGLAIRGGEIAYGDTFSSADVDQQAYTVRPLDFGMEVASTGEASEQIQLARIDVLLHCLSSTSTTWSSKTQCWKLFLDVGILDNADIGFAYGSSLTHIFCAALKRLSTSTTLERQIWRGVLLAEIPLLISSTIETFLPAEDCKAILADSLTAVSRIACSYPWSAFSDQTPTLPVTLSSKFEEVRANLANALRDLHLLDDSKANELQSSHRMVRADPLMVQLRAEAGLRKVGMSAGIASNHLSDASTASKFLERVIEEPQCAKIAGAAIIDSFKAFTMVATASLEALYIIVSALLDKPESLQTILLCTSATEIMAPLRCILINEEVLDNLCGPGAGGAEEAGMLSKVILFIQWLAQLSSAERRASDCKAGSGNLRTLLCPSTACAYPLQDLTEHELSLVSRWIAELFDSDGISDEIIRDSPPRLLIRLAPTLLRQSILAAEYGVIDIEMLKGGCSLFLQDLLSFTLPSGLIWLMEDLERTEVTPNSVELGLSKTEHGMIGSSSRAQLQVTLLRMLLLDESCPPLVLELVRPHFERLAGNKTTTGGKMGDMDAATLEALRTRFERHESNNLALPTITFSVSLPTPTEKSNSPCGLRLPWVATYETADELRYSLQPLFAKFTQKVSHSASNADAETKDEIAYLTSTLASMLAIVFIMRCEVSEERGPEDDEILVSGSDAQALVDILVCLDLLVPLGKDVSWIQPRVVVLSHVLNMLSHLPEMMGPLEFPGRKSQKLKSQHQPGIVDGQGMTIGQRPVELLGDDRSAKCVEPPDPTSTKPVDHPFTSRFANLARNASLAVLRAITVDPSSSSATMTLTTIEQAHKVLSPVGGPRGGQRGGLGSSEGQALRSGVAKNRHAAVWCLRSALQILPNSLSLPAENDRRRGRKRKLRVADGAADEGQSVARKQVVPTARLVLEEIVQAIWEVAVVAVQ